MARRALCPEVFQALGALPVRSSGSSDLNCGLIFRLQNLRLLKKKQIGAVLRFGQPVVGDGAGALRVKPPR